MSFKHSYFSSISPHTQILLSPQEDYLRILIVPQAQSGKTTILQFQIKSWHDV